MRELRHSKTESQKHIVKKRATSTSRFCMNKCKLSFWRKEIFISVICRQSGDIDIVKVLTVSFKKQQCQSLFLDLIGFSF